MKERLLIVEALFRKSSLVKDVTVHSNGEFTIATVECVQNVSFEVRYSESSQGYSLVDSITWDEYKGDDLNQLIQDCYKETKESDDWYKRICKRERNEQILKGDIV